MAMSSKGRDLIMPLGGHKFMTEYTYVRVQQNSHRSVAYNDVEEDGGSSSLTTGYFQLIYLRQSLARKGATTFEVQPVACCLAAEATDAAGRKARGIYYYYCYLYRVYGNRAKQTSL